MQLVLDPIWPGLLVALAIGAMVVLVLVTYPPRVRHLPPWRRRVLLGLRLAAVGLLALAMLRPEIQQRETDRKSSILMVIGDSSRSMNTQDGPGGLTRRQALIRTTAGAEAMLESLGEEIDVRLYDFAEQLTAVERFEDEAEGDQTAIGAMLDEVVREASAQRILGVLLLSDGAQRALPPLDVDPRAKARQLGHQGVPVYTIGFGGTELLGSVDVAIEDLLVDPLVFEKKVVPVTARVRIQGAAGRKVRVELHVEDRSGKRPGEAGRMAVPPAARNTRPFIELEPSTNSEVVPVELSYIPQQAGEFKVAVHAVPLDGELKVGNNTQSTIITVQKGGINVAYFDSIRPEQKFVRLVNRSDKIQLDFQPISGGALQARTAIDPEMFQPGRYDAYIIGDVPAEAFGSDLLRELRRRVDEGAGLLMTGGFRSFGPGGYAASPLARVLPVAMSPNEALIGGEIDESLHHQRELPMRPTRAGERHFLMRLDDPERNLSRWEALPPLEKGNKLRARNEFVEILAETPDRVPLLFAHEVGASRVVAFAGDTTWQWVALGHGDDHQRFWRQMILWLCRKDADVDQPVWARVDPRNFNPGQRATIAMGARTDEGEPIPDADFEVAAFNPAGDEIQLVPRREDDETTAECADTREPGDYWVRVTATKDGQWLGNTAWTRFIVDARDLELDNPAADLALLEEISALSGGSSVPAEQLGSFLHRLLEGGLARAEVTRVMRTRLWDNWPFLGAFVALLSLEWFLRKRRGLV